MSAELVVIDRHIPCGKKGIPVVIGGVAMRLNEDNTMVQIVDEALHWSHLWIETDTKEPLAFMRLGFTGLALAKELEMDGCLTEHIAFPDATTRRYLEQTV